MIEPLFCLEVKTPSHTYPIYIGAGLDLGPLLAKHIKSPKCLIVTNDVVAPLYLDKIKTHLQGFEVYACILPDGEAHKNQTSINAIYDALMSHHFGRDATIIALGGGVVGDMAGFAAASFMRGVNFIQIPTTLLAQVDSSVGGKTGINHPLGKNMIGAFWQPQAVFIDIETLSTLPAREVSAGLAEVVKYALIWDADFLSYLESHLKDIRAQKTQVLAQVVYQCCAFKADVVAQDEKEHGARALLNLGHTFGHVIETHEGYGAWLHGEAVAAGIVQALILSQKEGHLSACQVARVVRLLQAMDLPTQAPKIDLEVALGLMQHDKKVRQGVIRLVLLRALGQGYLTDSYKMTHLIETLQGLGNA